MRQSPVIRGLNLILHIHDAQNTNLCEVIKNSPYGSMG